MSTTISRRTPSHRFPWERRPHLFHRRSTNFVIGPRMVDVINGRYDKPADHQYVISIDGGARSADG
ncbi:hypothetical protein ACFFQF_17130 [Haladaptatus pallidirubidus]|uniref:hypothetical protein n=1 Tax=Haladaptatus pallidirubidus TaxID=1008152 RepID=UPI0035E9523C